MIVILRQNCPGGACVWVAPLPGVAGMATALTAGQATTNSPGADWSAEVKIKANMADLGMSFLPDLVGMHIRVVNKSTAGTTIGQYPGGSVWNNLPSWANLKLRYPIKYVIALDQSGSMLSDAKWTHAKNATNILANALACCVAYRRAAFLFRRQRWGDHIRVE
jgi:hypothetical protein